MFKLIALCSLLSFSAHANLQDTPPHIGPEGLQFSKIHIYKIEKLIENQLSQKELNADEATELKQIEMILVAGKKASKWIEIVNNKREPGKKLDLSSPTKSGGIPITAPQKSSTEIMVKRYEDFLTSQPAVITDVIKSNQDLPEVAPLSDAEFVTSLRILDRIYQSTIRWAGSRSWLSWYINRSIFDMRGFIFLRDTPDLEVVLKTYPTMSAEEKLKYNSWLLGICRNGDFDSSDCRTELTNSIKRNNLYGFYTRFNKYGQSMYDLFFTVKKTRKEMFWNPERTVLHAPFLTPDQPSVQSWLKENVEDEWKGTDFQLQIDFKKTTQDIPKIEFKEGVTAHVNGIAGNTITMEAEYPIETKDQKWTIRHEYGHVLGFEDCYLEFYDTNEKAMIYYEIDVDNLMCSRNGHLNSSHIEQLQKMYK